MSGDAIQAGDKVVILHGSGPLSRAHFDAMLYSLIGNREFATREPTKPAEPPRPLTEIEQWNADVDARKAAKRTPAPTGKKET